ncbi:longitudinals lacking isoform X4 [Rhynchophorus ferrugineus]|uniref:longitudinals lacking isoform X4 n=1 Tax=Rhynchophorus ferrugineus TaxID=354439 RepID=UPI003FCCAEA0
MDDDQQFCLRWNNHQSTLVAVFDTLLENGTLVDCTLAAEGKFLNAHKVVLSACSPYFEALLSRHYDKHPILILKDVKFQELKAMMDYMYRGEVNISQDQLGALLKAAESLQIKGLSDNKKEEPAKRPAPAPAPPKSPQPQAQLPKVQGLTIEQRSRDDREGSMSPGLRKKKRMRRKSEDMDNHDASNSSDAHSMSSQNIPSATSQISTANKMNSSDLPDTIETKQEIMTRHKEEAGSQQQVPMIKEKLETHTELMLEPKSEYVEEMNEDSIEDLTLDDDDISNMEQVDEGAGPSHGGEGSSQQGFGHWQMGNQSQDEVFLAAQEAVGAHRDSQVTIDTRKPLIKILRVEDLKNDDIVPRIKKELGFGFPLQKSMGMVTLNVADKNLHIDSKQEPVMLRGRGGTTAEKIFSISGDHDVIKQEACESSDSLSSVLTKGDDKCSVETFHELVVVPDDHMDIDKESNGNDDDLTELKDDQRIIIVKEGYGVFSQERRNRFLNMKADDVTPKKEKVPKCYSDLSEFGELKDQIRCSSCGILFDREIFTKHQTLCKGNKKKSKYGCINCSYTNYSLKELEQHIASKHYKPKNTLSM